MLVEREIRREGSTVVVNTLCEICGNNKWSSTERVDKTDNRSAFVGNLDVIAATFLCGIPWAVSWILYQIIQNISDLRIGQKILAFIIQRRKAIMKT